MARQRGLDGLSRTRKGQGVNPRFLFSSCRCPQTEGGVHGCFKTKRNRLQNKSEKNSRKPQYKNSRLFTSLFQALFPPVWFFGFFKIQNLIAPLFFGLQNEAAFKRRTQIVQPQKSPVRLFKGKDAAGKKYLVIFFVFLCSGKADKRGPDSSFLASWSGSDVQTGHCGPVFK